MILKSCLSLLSRFCSSLITDWFLRGEIDVSVRLMREDGSIRFYGDGSLCLALGTVSTTSWTYFFCLEVVSTSLGFFKVCFYWSCC